MKLAGTIILLCLLTISTPAWGATETLTWALTSNTNCSGGTNVSGGSVTPVNGSTYKAGTWSISSSKYQSENKNHSSESYWEDLSSCSTSGCADPTTTARLEFPITINSGYSFNLTGISLSSFEQQSGGGPVIQVYVVQGSTKTWVGGNYTKDSKPNLNTLNINLSAGTAKVVFILGVTSNLGSGRGFKFTGLTVTGTSNAAGSVHSVTATTEDEDKGTAATASASVVEGGTTTITATPKSGYRFHHWTLSGTGASLSSTTTNPTTLTMGTADATVTAYFEVIPTHSITYTNLKGADNSANPTSYYEGVGVASFTKLRHAVGYDFTGWYPSSISSSATTNQTIDAQWSANAVATGTGTLTYAFDYSDNTITTSSITRNNGALYDATDLTWTGVTIDDRESAERSGKITTTSSYDSSKYLTLTFKIADGYTFTPTEVQLQAVAVSHDKTIRFEFTDNAGTPNTKYLEQVRANGASVGTLTYDFDASDPVTLTGTVTVKIYAYGNTDSWRLGTPLTITGTVAAAVAPSTYSITYNCDDATSDCPSDVAAATNLPNPLPSAPTKTNYTFGGWYTNEGLTDVAVAGAGLTENVTLYAKWCANHTVSWVVNGSAYSTGSPTTSTNECAGITTMPTAPADNTLSGCANSFRGWSETNLYGEATNTQPADLFVDAAGAPTINTDKEFYAVFGTAPSTPQVGTVLWSEDWTGESNNAKPSSPTTGGGYAIAGASISYEYYAGDGTSPGDTYVTTNGGGNLAGGVSPEIILGKKGTGGTTGGYLIISGIPKEKAKKLTLSYKQNAVQLYVSVTGTGYSFSGGGTSVNSNVAGTKEHTIVCGTSETFSLTFTAPNMTAVRLDDIVVKIKEDGATGYRCICPSLEITPKLVTASTPIFITSAASKTIRSQDSLVIVGSGLQKSATLSISSPASKFVLRSRTNTALTTDATGSIDAVGYIYYTPDAGDTSDGLDKNASFTISDGTNTKTVNTALIGRHLPTDFVIAAKNGDTWYALPADKSTGTHAPVAITVDNATTPTSASTDDDNVYTLYGQTSKIVNQGEGQYVKLAMHGQSNAPLKGESSGTGIGRSLATNIDNDQSVDYWWALTQKNTSITNAADAKYNVSVANGNTNNPLKIWLNAGGTGVPKWGLYSSASNIITEIRLIPVCTAPTSPSITGTTAYTAGGDISLTASATGTISGVTTYQWYKGDPDDSGVSQGDASTSGATFTKASCVVGDAGTYYCVISNGACTVKVSQAITVSCATAPVAVTSLTCSAQTSSSLTYTWTTASNASGYTATLYPDEDCEETPVETKNLGDVATVTFETGLSASTTYYCKIQSKGNGTVYCEDGGTTSAVSGTTSAAAVLYTITYSAGASATCKSSDTQASAGADIALATPTWSDHTFLGWYVGDTKIGDAGDDYEPTADITVYGAWKEDCAGGSTEVYNGENVAKGSTTASGWTINNSSSMALTNGTSNGYSYWYQAASNSSDYVQFDGSASLVSGDQIKIKWTHTNGSSKTLQLRINDSQVSLTSGSTASSTTLVEAVYDLTSTTTVTSIKLNSSGSSGCIIYQVTIIRGGGTCYYVTYDGNGAEDGLTCDPTAYAANDDPVVLDNGDGGAAYTKDGYTFTGWNTEDDGTGDPYDADDVIENISENVILYAQWSSGDGYSITYHCNDATSGCPSNATEQTTLPNPLATPTKTNYTFGGWYTDAALSSAAVAGATLSANADLYAKWTQTVTLNTGSQGSGAAKTPTVVWQATALTGFSAHTASGYTLQGYYTAGSGGVKVLNADGTFAGSAVDGYITSSKWSRTGAAPTLYAQWVAASDCSTSDFVIKKGSSTEYQGCMESTSYNGTATSFTAGSATTVGNAKMTISSYSKGAITRPGSGNTFSIVIEPVSGYYLSSICWAGKVENDEIVYYYWDDNTAGKVTISSQTTSGTGVTYDAPNSSTTKFTAYYVDDGDDSGGIWWRNVQVEVCADGGVTYSVTYDGNDETGGTAPSDATSYSYGGTVTVLGNTGSLAKTNYSFVGWTTNDDGTGSSYVADNTFSITDNTTLYAKWTQAVTFDANTANHGSTGGSATAVWNATGLTGITHATPASGYKLTGYYTAATEGTKVLNSDGTFAGSNVTDYITDGKWSRTGAAPTLYAQYESSGALTWNLSVNTSASSLTTSSKSSAFTEIAVANMTNATVNGVTYTGNAKSSLTGKISTPGSYDADQYVYVTFQVASGYKFTPSSIKVKVQPISAAQYVKLELIDDAATPNSISYTTASKQSKGSISTIEMTNGSSVEFTGTVTLKIFCYGAEYATDGYRLGTPITIEGEVEESCATMPSYTSMSYSTTDYTVGDTPSAISISGATNVDTYLWKSNTTNDRTGGSAADGTNDESSYTPSTASAGTTYYWCEMTNTTCGITIKTPAVAVNVSTSKSSATVTWTNPGSTPNYGGGGYTIKATVDQTGWDGNAADLSITAPAGIRIYNVTSGTTSSQKWVQANFDVQTSFDRTTYENKIPFTVSADATTGYNAISDENDVSYSACTGGGDADETYLPVDVEHIDDETTVKGGWLYSGTGWIRYAHGSSSLASKNVKSLAHNMGTSNEITKYYKSSTNHFGFYTESAINGVRLYVYTTNSKVTVSGVYIGNSAYTSGTPSTGAITYEATYYNDDDGLLSATNDGCTWVEIIFDNEVAAGKYGQINLSGNVYLAGMAFLTTSGSGASLTTTLAFATTGTIEKQQSSANFTNAASVTAYSETLGAITYSSSNTDCATVNATTGEVTITASGASNLSTTITATLAASGCYKGATTTYTISVPGVSCTVEHGTLTSDVTSKCSTADATLTLTGFESGASVQWYNGETTISNGATYAITTAGTTSTLVTKEAGTYSVMVTNATCSDRSNSITITNISADASVTKIVDSWYIKNGRLTPDIALWSLSDGATLKSVAWSPSNATGLACVERDGIIYLEGKEPNTNSSSDVVYTLTATVTDACNTDHEQTTKTITITHQKNTDKHVLAFIVTGTGKGGFTEGISADQTTNVELYNTIAANFDVLATNIYSTDDEKKLKEYYSQFDILCVTDYPNTQTKGTNSKSYVDALGALIDIRPILTMEAFVSKLANWKEKGISGTPKSPTTRQYSMLLQCKDHEIFAGTELTKVGEGDETMYRVNMVDNTKEDYATLDATYGAGAHEEKKNYNYGGKPALQGFTFDATMAADRLLPLGLIDDGAGNDLQVGIERQAEMSARLMVLGINSYAMERLTDDGQTVVVNALKYLMKKNEEEIADCSTVFVGGDDSKPTDWNTAANWSTGSLPDNTTHEIRIVAPVVITDGQTIHAKATIKIAPNGKYNGGSDNAEGSITINAGGTLVVDGEILAATAPNYSAPRATSPSDLVLNTSETKQACLIFDNANGETQATVEMYSPSYWELNGGKKKKYWSYVGVPIQTANIPEYFYGGFTYLYDETSGWIKKGNDTQLHAFEPIGLAAQSGHRETFYGPLASTADQEITLTYTGDAGAGKNMIGNSWTAPIQIANFEASDFGSATATVMIFNTGNDNLHTDVTASAENDGAATAGQWLCIPIGVPSTEGYDGLKVIPAMQAFEVNTLAETTLKLDYDKLVRTGALTNAQAHEPMRAPVRRSVVSKPTKKSIEALLRVRVSGTKTHTDTYLLQDARFSDAFDNGWESEFTAGDNRSAQLYSVSEIGNMAFLAKQDIEGTVLGFAPSRDGNEYTFSFRYTGTEELYLSDLKLQESTLITDNSNYSFTYEEGDTNRFIITATPFIKVMPTGVDKVQGDKVQSDKVRKVLIDDHLYIIRAGKVFDATGAIVK